MRSPLYLIVLLSFFQAVGTELDTIEVRDLSRSWLVFDKQDQLTQTFEVRDIRSGGFFLVGDELENHLLKVCGDDFDIWIDGQLHATGNSGCQVFNVEALTGSPRDTLFVVVASDQMRSIDAALSIVEEGAERLYESPVAKKSTSFNFYVVFSLMLFLFFMSLLKRNKINSLAGIWGLSKSNPSLDDGSVNSLPAIALLTVFSSFLLVINHHFFDFRFFGPWALVVEWLVVVLFLSLKSVIILLFSRLFNFKGIASLQFKQFVVILAAIMILTYLLQLLFVWFGFFTQSSFQGFKYISIVVCISYVIWAYSMLANEFSSQKLHLISYLCTTEIFPTFVLAYWLFS